MRVHRWTPLVVLWPTPYLDPDATANLSLKTWSADSYTWRQDDWHGLKDVAQPVTTTLRSGAGDCEDYALVAASWGLAHDRSDMRLGLCFEGWQPTHMIAVDATRTYSSGAIREESLAAYQARTRFDRILTRQITAATLPSRPQTV